MTSSLAKSKQIIGAHFHTVFFTIFLFLMFLNIHIYFIILKTHDQRFTLTTKKYCMSSLRAVSTGGVHGLCGPAPVNTARKHG